MKITLPPGYVPPENARPGEPFEVVAVIEPEEDGSFELKSIDGVELGKEEEMSQEQKFATKVPMPWDNY